ncbi:MAG: S8 family peptidase [Bryobacteraceae bacterium]
MKKAALALIFAGCACWAAPAHKKISKDLDDVDALSNVKIIIQWKSNPDTKTQRILNRGGVLHAVHRSIKAGTYTVPASILHDLENDPDVVYITPDRPVSFKLDYTAAAINASYAWNSGYNGAGIGVAVLDSGINPSDPNLGQGPSNSGSRVVYTQDFVGGNGQDQYGHGHHIAGIIGSNGYSTSAANCSSCSRQLIGIAPGSTILNFRVLDQNGQASDSIVISAIEQAIALQSTHNIRVINLSLGRPVYESYTLDPLCQAVEAAWKAGIVVVVAAGNDGRDDTYGEQGYGTITVPGNDPYVITVGGMKTMGTDTRIDDLIASYSSKGPTQIDHIVKPDVVAPGNGVVSLLASSSVTLAREFPSNTVTRAYYQDTSPGIASKTSKNFFTLNGTSMATGVVSGAVADILQANPKLTPDQVKALIMQTAYKTFPVSSTATDPVSGLSYVDYYDIFTVGAGYLDLEAALQSINNVPAGTALSPVANYTSSSGTVTLSYGSTDIWSTRAVWGAQSVWGNSVVTGNRAVWGAQAVWGASNPSSSQSVWGAQAVWGAQSIWGANNSSGSSTSSALSVAIRGEQ